MRAINVRFDTHAPNEWNTPVPIEVFDDAMKRVGQPRVLRLASGGELEVDRPGRYYVLATLPTGESVGASVEVTEDAKAPADAVLVLGESSPWETLAWAFTRQRLPRERAADKVLPVERFEFVPMGGVSLEGAARVDVLGMADRRGRWILEPTHDATSWDPHVQNADPRLLGQLTIRRLPHVPIDPGERHHRNARWYPLLVRYRLPTRGGATTFVAVPAGQAVGEDHRQETVVLFARPDGVTAGSTVRTLVSGARAEAEALLSYFENGVFAAARHLSEDLVGRAVSLLWDKLEDPFGAAMAGYVLLRTAANPRDRQDKEGWMRNLANWFPLIPDGPVIYAASLLRRHPNDDPAHLVEARSYLLEAVARGIPTYTIGLRLLFDTLRSLAEERERDAELAAALAKIRAVAAYADWTAQTTTLTYSNPTALEGVFEMPNE